MSSARQPFTPLRLGWNMFAAPWRRLMENVRAPYQPELHYMRGPRPKWRARHQEGATDSALIAARSPAGLRHSSGVMPAR